MHLLAVTLTPNAVRLLMLLGSATMLYVLGRIAMGVIPRGMDGSSVRALLSSGIVLVVGATAACLGRPDVGLHLPIAAASGALSYGIAATILGRGPRVRGNVSNSAGLRSWAFVLPAVAIVLVGAMGGPADWLMLAALVGYGAAALLAWLPDRALVSARTPSTTGASGGAVFGESPVVAQPVPAAEPAKSSVSSRVMAVPIWSVSAILAGLAGFLAVRGMPVFEAMHHVPPDAVVTVFLLAPAIVVPLVFELLPPCRPIGWTASISTLTKFAVLCLCISLPAIVLVSTSAQVWRGWAANRDAITTSAATTRSAASVLPQMPATAATSMPTTAANTAISSTQPANANSAWPTINFPSLPGIALSTDVLTLAAASLLLLPLASGWLRPGKLEAAALFGCYLVNLYLLIHTMYA